MLDFDENRLRYPNDYVEVLGIVSQLKTSGGFVDFLLTFDNGHSIMCRVSADLAANIKEGKIVSGKIESTIGFKLNGKNLSEAKPYLRIESWENVKIE